MIAMEALTMEIVIVLMPMEKRAVLEQIALLDCVLATRLEDIAEPTAARMNVLIIKVMDVLMMGTRGIRVVGGLVRVVVLGVVTIQQKLKLIVEQIAILVQILSMLLAIIPVVIPVIQMLVIILFKMVYVLLQILMIQYYMVVKRRVLSH